MAGREALNLLVLVRIQLPVPYLCSLKDERWPPTPGMRVRVPPGILLRKIIMTKLMGKFHDRQCDCNIEQYVSGAGEKCNHRYGVKRQRSREKGETRREVQEETA
jgi:hypothetical protein